MQVAHVDLRLHLTSLHPSILPHIPLACKLFKVGHPDGPVYRVAQLQDAELEVNSNPLVGFG